MERNIFDFGRIPLALLGGGLIGIALMLGCGQNSNQESADSNVQIESDADRQVADFMDQLSLEEAERVLAEWVNEANQLEREFKFDESVSVWQKIVPAVESQAGSESWQAINARLSLETARQQANFSEQQLNLLKQTVEWRNQVLSDLQSGRMPDAVAGLQQIDNAFAHLYGADSHGLGRVKVEIAQLYYQQGDHSQTVHWLEQALAINRVKLGEMHPETESNLFTLGQSQMHLGDFEAGIERLESALQLSRQLWGEQHLVTASRINDLGVAYQTNGQLNEARAKFSSAIDIRQQLLPEDHFALGESIRNLGVTFLDQGNAEQASKLLTRAVAIFEKSTGRENLLTLDTRSRLATSNMLEKEYLFAENQLRQVVHEYQSQGVEGLILAKAEYQLGVALCYQGQYQEAEPILTRALNSRRNVLGQWHEDTVKTMKTLAVLYERTDQMDKRDSINSALQRLQPQQDK